MRKEDPCNLDCDANSIPSMLSSWNEPSRAPGQRKNLILNSIIAGVAIILLLSIVIRGWRNLLLILVNLPFALVGEVLAVFGTGGFLTLGSMIGFVTVFGITVRWPVEINREESGCTS
jgi:Cu/Ag efflux pump CusA